MWHFTHFYEFLYLLVKFLTTLMTLAFLFDFLPLPRFGNDIGFLKSYGWIWGLVIFVGSWFGILYLLEKTLLPDWLPTYLYIRRKLHTEVSPSDAKKLSFLFDGSLDGKWYPLHEIRELRPESRREALFQFAKNVVIERAK